MKRKTIEDCQILAAQHGGKCISTEYKNSWSKLGWQCEKGHAWEAIYNIIQQGCWCPKCVRNNIADCRELAMKKNGKCLSVDYTNSVQKLEWQCEKGHTWKALYSHVKSGSWCFNCSLAKKRNTLENCHKLAQNKNGKFLSIEYKNAHTKYAWECSFGHRWFASYNTIQRNHWCRECSKEQIKQTCLKKYGTKSANQCKEIALKQAKSCNNSYIFYHWKTCKEIICQGSYEKKVIEHLNKNEIDFAWQSRVFIMPGGKTYRPDLYLTQEDRWVEIKGYFRKDAKEKWDWFQGMYPNSELWDTNRLKEIKIL